jgi:hypothetical protein
MRRGAVAVVAFACLGAFVVQAQRPDSTKTATASFRGRLFNSIDSTPVRSADVRLLYIDSAKTVHTRFGGDSIDFFVDTTRSRVGATDSLGVFAIRRLAGGRYVLQIRRIGFSPLQGGVIVDSTELDTALPMEPTSQLLAKVRVTERSVDAVKQRLERVGFDTRYHMGTSGTWVTRADILKRQPQTLGDILATWGVHSCDCVMDRMPTDYESAQTYPADLVIGVEIYRHNRPTDFNMTRSGPNLLQPGGASNSMTPLVLIWTYIP